MSELYAMNPKQSDCGCWFDGDIRGQFTGEAVIAIASVYGFDAGDAATVDKEWHWEVVQEAEDFLNDLIDYTEFSFGFHDGSFYLLSREEWKEIAV